MKPKTDLQKKSLDNAIYEGAANSASTSITDSYTTPFLLSLGASNFQIGMLNSVKDLANIFSQVPGPTLTERFNRKKIFIFSVITSKLLWLPVIIIPFLLTSNIIFLLMAIIAASVFFQTIRNPAWTSLIGDIVPHNIRGRYFSKRNTITGACGLGATLLAGLALNTYGFSIIFAISILLGMLSILFFMRIREPHMKTPYFYKRTYSFSFREYIRFFKSDKKFSSFTLYVGFLNFAVDFVAPFIAVYILKNLAVSYELFAASIALGALSRIVSQRYWGYLADRFGNRRIMYIGCILASFIPFFYAFSSNIYHIFFIKIYDGFAWAGFDLAKFNYLLAITPSEKRPTYVANYNIFIILGSVIGAATGAFFVEHISEKTLLIFYDLQIAFLLSFVLRLSSLALLRFVKDVEKKEDVPVHYVMLHPISTGIERGMTAITTFTTRYPTSIKNLKEYLEDGYKRKKYLWKVGRKAKSYYEPEPEIE